MKLVRSVAYAVIVICMILCIVIAIYAAKKPKDEEGGTTASSSQDAGSASQGMSVTIPDLTSLIPDRPSSGASAKPSISGNNTGEIAYDEIVRLQNEDLDREFRAVISEYNKKYGIVTSNSSSTSTSATTHKEYNYFVNKNTKVIHRIDCLLKPVNSADALYYETITAAGKAGYTERCPVCSP